MCLQTYMTEHPEDVKKIYTRLIDITRSFTVMEMKSGEVFVETETIDEEDITTIEVLRSNDRTHFTLVWRERKGEAHNEMRTYPRDEQYPLFSMVKLNANL